jgi:hypothetical protein
MSTSIPLVPVDPRGAISSHPNDPSDASEAGSQVPKAPGLALSVKEVQKKPWKYIGYKVFSQWIGSDADFFVLRRFDSLNARVILALQWELCALERKLNELDIIHSAPDAPDVHNGSFKWDDPDRTELIGNIHKKLKEYS